MSRCFKAVFRGPVLLVTRKLRAQNSNQHATPQWRSIWIEGERYGGSLILNLFFFKKTLLNQIHQRFFHAFFVWAIHLQG